VKLSRLVDSKGVCRWIEVAQRRQVQLGGGQHKEVRQEIAPLVTRRVVLPSSVTLATLPLVSRSRTFSYAVHPSPDAMVKVPRSVMVESGSTGSRSPNPRDPPRGQTRADPIGAVGPVSRVVEPLAPDERVDCGSPGGRQQPRALRRASPAIPVATDRPGDRAGCWRSRHCGSHLRDPVLPK